MKFVSSFPIIFLMMILFSTTLSARELIYESFENGKHYEVFLVKETELYHIVEVYEDGVFGGVILTGLGLLFDAGVSYAAEKIAESYDLSEFTVDAIGYLAGGFSGMARKGVAWVVAPARNYFFGSKTISSMKSKSWNRKQNTIDIEVTSTSRQDIRYVETALNIFELHGLIQKGIDEYGNYTSSYSVKEFTNENYSCYHERLKSLRGSSTTWIEYYEDGLSNTVLCCDALGKYCSYETSCNNAQIIYDKNRVTSLTPTKIKKAKTKSNTVRNIANTAEDVALAIGSGLLIIGKGVGLVFTKIDMTGIKVEGGLTGRYLSINDGSRHTLAWHGSAGLVARYYIADKINFQWELLYGNKGHSIDSTIIAFNQGVNNYEVTSQTLNINYIYVPAMFNITVDDGIDLTLGGYIGQAIKGNIDVVKTNGELLSLDIFEQSDFPTLGQDEEIEPFSKLDIGILLGINLHGRRWDNGLRLYRGFNNISNQPYWQATNVWNTNELNHWILSIYATLRLHTRKDKKPRFY